MPPPPVEPSLPTQRPRPVRPVRGSALGGRMPWWRRTLRKLQGLPVDSTSHTMLPVLMEVFAGFSKIDGSIMEEEIDSSLGFMRYDYPEAIYSELRRIYFEALQKPQDLSARARELSRTLSIEQKILLGVQLYLLISRSDNSRQQLVEFYLFMTNLGIAAQAIDIVYQLNADDKPSEETDFSGKAGQPLEMLRIASEEPCDVLLRSLSSNCSVAAFRYQNLMLLKNTGTVPVLVRSRTLKPGDFSRLYQGERVVLEDISLDYADLTGYFNAKKNLTGTQLYLTLTEEGSAEISQTRNRNTNLRISFGLGVTIEALRDTDAKINGRRLKEGTKIDASIEDKIIAKGEVEISLQELRRRAREFGEQFRLEGSRNTYLVSNNPDLLEEGDILLSQDGEGEILLKIVCDYEEKTGSLEILRSDRPIYVGNTVIKERARLNDGDTLTLGEGQYLRCHFADRIIEEERNVIRHVELREVGHRYGGQGSALDGISLSVRRGEMICVMGPSGCGKSTLLRVLGGQLKPKVGDIMMNGFPLYGSLPNLTPYIAYIPQEDAFDALLKVQENLDYSVAVRCPHLPAEERRKRVDAKLVELGLNELRHRLAGTPEQKHLSGGERKRLNAGLDMIGIADVYLFDEPTSGLSSKDSEHVLELIRSLARNKIVMCSIHQPSMKLLQMFDKALLLDKGGKMAFFGTPQGMLEYFWGAYCEETGQAGNGSRMGGDLALPDIVTPDLVFDVLETPLRDISGDIIHEQTSDGHLVPARRFPPNFWRDRFQTHVLLRSVSQQETRRDHDHSRHDSLSGHRKIPKPPRLTLREEGLLLATMIKRAFLSKLRNRANLLTTLLEAPMLAVLISMVLRYSEDDSYTFASAFHIPSYLFLTLVVAMFLGLTNSADEVIRDRHMLNRERNHNLRIGYYVTGKILSLSAFALIQCVIYLIIGNAILELREMFLVHLFWMFLTSLSGAVLGLLVSTLVHDIRTALNIIPLMLIPQIILGGALIKYEEMNRNLDFVYSIRHWVEKKEGAEAEPASKLKVPFICHFMPLRWSYESAIISQAKLNPLSVAQAQLEDRIQEFANLPRHIPLTEKQRKDMDLAKQALAVVSGLSGEDANVVGERLALIRKGLQSGRLDPSLLEARSKKGVSADEIYVNQKVLDLVNKAEMEREDYRRKESPNVFFGTVKTYHPFGKPDDSAAPQTELTRDTPALKKPWYEEFKISTLWMNFFVIMFGLAVVVTFLMFALKRQLSKV
ncbi:ATP-binding cassette domain-containing protein [Roseimicrobium sp. ORNL1]|uniref:ATP-binding cassette domain-containing protein n=1 Tax=Roseimicrobium sp. ORNL1 TaxID=2711231 RepID=UPI0013E1E96D|nr:ATP-binding cassette domain-containing protein [Roseimicrobium sp. ORNL1]QIF01485.1 ATP-binding cassette domain-containing protein [Roseimicrobium sp. ORNL1]